MANITPTPAQIRVTGSTGNFFNGIWPTAAALSVSGGSITLGTDLSSGLTGESVKLDRLMRANSIVDGQGLPTMQFQALWQRFAETIEQAFADDQSQIDALDVIVAQLQALINAQAATSAQVATVQSDLALVNSKTNPVDGLLSATSAGVINISAHTREYADGTSVAVNSGSISGFSEGQFVRVYYDDAARAGGAVSYQGTTEEITQTGARHVIGGVTIPAAGQPPVEGVGTTPPGYVRNISEF